jgi:hypothetical protein
MEVKQFALLTKIDLQSMVYDCNAEQNGGLALIFLFLD